MKRHFTIFLIALLVFATFGLIYSSMVVADLTYTYPIVVDAPGTKIILEPTHLVNTGGNPQAYLLEAQQVVTRRLAELQPEGQHQVVVIHDRIEVTLPKGDQTPHLINVIARVGEVEFINGGSELPPIGRQVQTGPETVAGQNIYQTLFTGREIVEIIPPNSGDIFYRITPAPAAVTRLAEFIEKGRMSEYICLVIDKQVVNCSKMYYWSGQTLDILPNIGGSADLSLADLGVFLKSGPLPLSLDVAVN
jgi:hypothetical protein